MVRGDNDWAFEQWARRIGAVDPAPVRPPVTDPAWPEGNPPRKLIQLRQRFGDDCCWAGTEFCLFPGEPMRFGAHRNDPKAASIEHIVPRSQGGGNDTGNVRLAHRRCNNERHDHPHVRKTRAQRRALLKTAKRCRRIVKMMRGEIALNGTGRRLPLMQSYPGSILR